MIKILTVRVENNSAVISDMKELRKSTKEYIEENSIEVDSIQQENLLKILTYIKCIYDDYVQVSGGYENALNKALSVRSSSIEIRAINNKCVVFFDYSGTPYCKNTPKRIEASFVNNEVKILQSTQQGITDLCLRWKECKPKFKKQLDDEIERMTSTIIKNMETVKYNKEIAMKFEV